MKKKQRRAGQKQPPPKPPIRPLRIGQTLGRDVGPIQHRLIGQFIVTWSRIENALDDLIWTLLAMRECDGRILTKRFDARTKIVVLRELFVEKLSDDMKDELFGTLASLDQIREERNVVAHGLWHTIDGVPATMSLRQKAEEAFIVSETFPAKKLRSLIAEASELLMICVQLRDKLAHPN